MKVLTPEIAWHQTLPIYSCDLQPFIPSSHSHNVKEREPLVELSPTDFPPSETISPRGESKDDARTIKAESVKNPIEAVFGETWTRLATAGGDSVVRLWRVNLDWMPPSSVTVTTFKKPLPKGMLQSVASEVKITTSESASSAAGATSTAPITNTMPLTTASLSGRGNEGVKVSAPISEGLVFLATLKRHERLVNVVRWSPSGKYLASGGDDQFIIIWGMQPEIEGKSTITPTLGEEEDEPKSLETWIPLKSLRRHLEDVYDLCWSPDETAFISGSVDQSVILWQLDLSGEIGTSPGLGKAVVLRDHKHYVQGVAWDPLGVYVVSLSSDRSCRVYKVATEQCVATFSKVEKCHLFQDDSWKSFFRRPSFSPDGLLLVCPAGNLETAPYAGDMSSVVSAGGNKSASIASKVDATDSCVSVSSINAPQHAAHIFLRNWTKKPCVSLPTGPRPVIAVRFCPQPFQLRMTNPEPGVAYNSLFQLPYRWLFCLVLDDGLLFFDTQQAQPFSQISQIHYQSLNDAAWSSDGRLVTVTSTDGYCSLIYFSLDELGVPYRGPLGVNAVSAIPDSLVKAEPSLPKMEPKGKIVIEKSTETPGEKKEKPSKSEDRRHISFELGIKSPDKPHVSLPVTPNTGRYLSAPIAASPMTKTPISARSKETGEKRRIQFITLSTSTGLEPSVEPAKSQESENQSERSSGQDEDNNEKDK